MTEVLGVAPDAREPDLRVGEWRLWRAPAPPLTELFRGHAHATLGVWLVHQPGVHLFWAYWWVTLIHLRPTEELGAAKTTAPGATHEVLCLTQDPEAAPAPDDLSSLRVLQPPDWVWQFTASSDALAVQSVDVSLREGFAHHVPVDADYARFWADLLRGVARRLANAS